MKHWYLKRSLISHDNRSSLQRFLADQIIHQPSRLLMIGFALIIVLGTVLLLLPYATVSGKPLSVLNALFTSTSATCVTGLVVLDTGTTFSGFGQSVILALIQIGGLGIMTFSTFVVFLISGRLGITEREVLIDTLSRNPTAELTKLLKLAFFFTITIESVGWLFLTLRFWQSLPLGEAIYQGLFHSVSAFCNAGFSLFSDGFISYREDPVINIILMMLIILGGLGFIVIFDLYKNRHLIIHRRPLKFSLHTRLVLASTAILIAGGALLFFVLENTNVLKNLPIHEKIMASLFQSITTRTAGFNTVHTEHLTSPTLFLFIVLMFIGASPGSCGGGIKTTTMALVIISIFNHFRQYPYVNLFHRKIPDTTISRLIPIMFFSVLIIIIFTGILLVTEGNQLSQGRNDERFLEILFEAVSAFGTVGLSMGATNGLTPVGKILIVVLMFIGRIGPLTVALAISGKPKTPVFKYLQEDVMIG